MSEEQIAQMILASYRPMISLNIAYDDWKLDNLHLVDGRVVFLDLEYVYELDYDPEYAILLGRASILERWNRFRKQYEKSGEIEIGASHHRRKYWLQQKPQLLPRLNAWSWLAAIYKTLNRSSQDDVRYVKPVVDAKAEKGRLKKEEAAAAAAAGPRAAGAVKELAGDAKGAVAGGTNDKKQQKKEKKEKAPKQPKPQRPAAPLSPCLMDLRVSHILKATRKPTRCTFRPSPSATSPSTTGPSTRVQGRKVVVVCSLEPVKMRGVKSCAMVLAASPDTRNDNRSVAEN
ncbi:hypothetical protein MY11210_009607 [Beauveria gryllotalpidicola]